MGALPRSSPPAQAIELKRWTLTTGAALRQMRIELREALQAHRLAAHTASPVAERAALVATELAGNALRHSRSPAVVRLLRVDSRFDGNPTGAITRPADTANGNGVFKIGDYETNGTHAGYFNGEIADVQTWNKTLSPDQITTIANVRDRILFPSDNTTYKSGTTWTSPCATMTFSEGQLAIKETCSKTDTVTFGTTGAVLGLQSDGNLVIYATTGAVLWASGTFNH